MSIQAVGGSNPVQTSQVGQAGGSTAEQEVTLAFATAMADNLKGAIDEKVMELVKSAGESRALWEALQFFETARPQQDEAGARLQIDGRDFTWYSLGYYWASQEGGQNGPADAHPASAPEYLRHQETLQKHGLWKGFAEKDGMVQLTTSGAHADLTDNVKNKIAEMAANEQRGLLELTALTHQYRHFVDTVSSLTAQQTDQPNENMAPDQPSQPHYAPMPPGQAYYDAPMAPGQPSQQNHAPTAPHWSGPAGAQSQ